MNEELKQSILGQRIDYLLLKKGGIKKGVFCDALNISRQTLNNINKGIMPNAEKLLDIADYFETSTDFLLGRTNIEERLTEKVDILNLSQGAREVLSDNTDYGHIISLLLENESFRRLMSQIKVYYNTTSNAAVEINNSILKAAKKLKEKKISNSNDVTDDFDNYLNIGIQSYDNVVKSQFANDFANIITEIKSVYSLDNKTKDGMQYAVNKLIEISENILNSQTNYSNTEEMLDSFVTALQNEHLLGANEETYVNLKNIIQSQLA